MTLAKRHFIACGFCPGSSGAIPSRAEYGMSQADFDRAMRTSSGARWSTESRRSAGTLLLLSILAHEGYFVRTLGMHRVYNSAS